MANKSKSLIVAARKGHLDKVKRLVNQGLSGNERGRFGHTALIAAANNGHIDVVNCLIEMGVELDSEDSEGGTALHYAALNGHLSVVRALLEAEATVKSTRIVWGDVTVSPLHVSIQKGFVDISKLLLAHGALAVTRQAYEVAMANNQESIAELIRAELSD